MSDYVFFYTGPFCQWHRCQFTSADGLVFNCAEQYMMYHKAMLFGDQAAANKILSKSSPRDQKALGRKVKNFDEQVWNQHARSIVFSGNYYKFTQNPHLKSNLLATCGKTLVEASPTDRIWGIGLNQDAAEFTDPDDWPGTNWLGEVLTHLALHLTADHPGLDYEQIRELGAEFWHC